MALVSLPALSPSHLAGVPSTLRCTFGTRSSAWQSAFDPVEKRKGEAGTMAVELKLGDRVMVRGRHVGVMLWTIAPLYWPLVSYLAFS